MWTRRRVEVGKMVVEMDNMVGKMDEIGKEEALTFEHEPKCETLSLIFIVFSVFTSFRMYY